MQQHEFEALTGNKIESEEYAKIERVYMAASDAIDKAGFCKAIKKANTDARCLLYDLTKQVERFMLKVQNLKHSLEQEREIKSQQERELESLRNANTTLIEDRNEAIAQKVEMATVLLKAGMENEAAEILGRGYVISLKCSLGMEFSEEDRKCIAQVFGNKR